MITEIQNPHDQFVRSLLSNPRLARNFLENYLPEKVVAKLNFDTLELSQESFVDEDLREALTETFPEKKNEIMMTIAREWIEEGRQEGRQEGVLTGQQQGELAVTLRILRKRFSNLDVVTIERIQLLSAEKLEDLGYLLFDFKSVADLNDWLKRSK